MKVILHKLFPYAPYLNEYIGYEESLPDGCTDEEALAMTERLRKLAERSHKEKYPHLYTDDGRPVIVKQAEPDPKEDEEINARYFELCEKITAAKYKEDALELLNNSDFKLNLDLKRIVSSKPSYPTAKKQ